MIEKKYFSKFQQNPGLSIENASKIKTSINLPTDYYELLEYTNGGKGFIGEEYIILYELEELENINNEYNVSTFIPDLYLIGSNGSSEAIAIDFSNHEIKYVLIPFIFDKNDQIELGRTINELLERIYNHGFFL